MSVLDVASGRAAEAAPESVGDEGSHRAAPVAGAGVPLVQCGRIRPLPWIARSIMPDKR
ncbi:MAG TPA: hypothetical protein VGR57_02115 [Ktedonobacterales bacterium]|nr:hypothetical protein [Ktedonobacterales bacterium]